MFIKQYVSLSNVYFYVTFEYLMRPAMLLDLWWLGWGSKMDPQIKFIET